METLSTKIDSTHAVVDMMPETAGYTPVVMGPPPNLGHGRGRPRIAGDATTMPLLVWAGDTTFNGTVNLEIQFFGLNEDGSGNISLVDNVVQIPDQNGNGGANRKQPVQINGQTKTSVNVYIVPNATEVEIMALVRPVGGGPTGNVGVYFFTVE